MKLTKKRKDAINSHLKNIAEMGKLELTAFDMKLQDVKNDMDSVIFKWVNKGVLSQLQYLDNIDKETGGAMAVISELRVGET